jgi:magnesium-transporting ATPase (P-type)
MVIYEFVRLADIRSDYRMKWWSNPLITISLVASMGIQLAIIYVPALASLFKVTPISGQDWLVILGSMFGLFAVMKLLNPLLDYVGPEYGDVPKKT